MEDNKTVEWFQEDARTRTTLVRRSYPLSMRWPSVVFAVVRASDGRFVSLHSFRSDARVELESAPLYSLPHGSYLNGNFTVCLGDAYDRVIGGELDPMEAFWNTAFPEITDSSHFDLLGTGVGVMTTPADFEAMYRAANHTPVAFATAEAQAAFGNSGITTTANTVWVTPSVTGTGWASVTPPHYYTTTTAAPHYYTTTAEGGYSVGLDAYNMTHYTPVPGSVVTIQEGQQVTIMSNGFPVATFYGPITLNVATRY